MKSRPLGVQSILATDHNTRRDDARGGSFLLAHQQLGALALGTTPTSGQTVTFVVNGTSVVFTAVTGTPTNPGDVKAPGTALGFVTNLISALRRPDLTTSTFIALSGPNQALIQYVGWAWPGSSTNIVPFSPNKNVNGASASLTSFNITTTVTSGTWAAQTMQLYVEDGTYYINGTRYLFTGASTPTAAGPVSNPRIDVLTIDTSGTLAWTTGTENASPSAPAYPANKLAICELYNVVSETALYDNENQQSGQGYILNDVRPSVTAGPTLGAIPDDLIPDAADTRSLGSSSYEWNNIYGKNIYAGIGLFVGGNPVASAKFGGTGADGALSATSGATNINLGNAAVVIKNYTSISITGTGYITFSNPNTNGTIVILKSQGNVILTSSATALISTVGMGGQSVAAQTTGNYGTSNFVVTPQGGGAAGGSSNGGAGIFISAASISSGLTLSGSKYIPLICGASGGGGSVSVSKSGAGALYIESAGALNFTGTINAAGTNATGDGGAGGGGTVVILYNTLTANTGTITTTGGSSASSGYFSAGGGAAIGGNGGGGSAGGGAGGAGYSMVAKNTEFA